ncbi:hypothetical protein FC35_GL000535 [Limosilactobacillus coleohominis DSM 14060]|nr:hypothetical protein FC35_GL000535 [Limosilactobacillus coleohominis DSM 14060]
MINQVMNKTWGSSPAFNRLNDWQKRVLFNFIQNTGLQVYIQWVKNGKKEPLEDVIGEAIALMEGGVKAYLQLN